MTGQLWRLPLRGEDLALVGWNLVSILVGLALGGSWSGTDRDPLIGFVELLAIHAGTSVVAPPMPKLRLASSVSG